MFISNPMRFILIFCLLCVGSSSVAQVTPTRKYVKVLEATQRRWSPGTVQKNTNPSGGFIFEIKVRVKKSGDWHFQQGAFDNKTLPIEVTKQGERTVQGPWRKREVLTLIARTNDAATAAQVEEEIARAMASSEAAGWLVLKENDKMHLVPIKNIKTVSSHQKLNQ